jgi:hypothetical protein
MIQPNDHSAELPRALLGPKDAEALVYILDGYIAYTRRAVPASRNRDAEISLLQHLRRQFALLQGGHLAQLTIPLSLEEMEALEHAMSVFIGLVRKNVAPSDRREHTLACIDELRQAIARMRTQWLN